MFAGPENGGGDDGGGESGDGGGNETQDPYSRAERLYQDMPGQMMSSESQEKRKPGQMMISNSLRSKISEFDLWRNIDGRQEVKVYF